MDVQGMRNVSRTMGGGHLVAGIAIAGVAVGGASIFMACIGDLPPDAASADGGVPEAELAEVSTLEAGVLCGNGLIDLDAGEQCDPGPSPGSPSYTACTANCRMDCPNGHVGAANHHCYELATAASLLETAKSRCAALSMAHVVTFSGPPEVSDVSAWLGRIDAGTPAFWVGLIGLASEPNQYGSLGSYEPGWSPTCPGCFAPVADAAAPFPPYVPDGGAAATACVATTPAAGATYSRAGCAQPLPLAVVCEHEPAGDLYVGCDGGVCIQLAATHGSESYLYVPDLTTAAVARASCRAIGGTLVVFRTQEEREELWHELAILRSPPSSIWIGLGQSGAGAGADSGAGDGAAASATAWVWEDGASIEAYPSPWAANEPKAAAVGAWAYGSSAGTVDMTLAFADLRPASTRTFVCELGAGAN